MTIEEAVVQVLRSDPTLNPLVGEKIYPQGAPENESPPMVLYVTSDPYQEMTLTGYLNLYNQSFRFDCYGAKIRGYASAKQVAGAVRSALFGFFRGDVVGPAGQVTIQAIYQDGGEDGLELPIHGDEQGLDYVAVQVRVWWNL